jgi:hypothetical protein
MKPATMKLKILLRRLLDDPFWLEQLGQSGRRSESELDEMDV